VRLTSLYEEKKEILQIESDECVKKEKSGQKTPKSSFFSVDNLVTKCYYIFADIMDGFASAVGRREDKIRG
jgi:hypothetical protein